MLRSRRFFSRWKSGMRKKLYCGDESYCNWKNLKRGDLQRVLRCEIHWLMGGCSQDPPETHSDPPGTHPDPLRTHPHPAETQPDPTWCKWWYTIPKRRHKKVWRRHFQLHQGMDASTRQSRCRYQTPGTPITASTLSNQKMGKCSLK